MSQEDDEQERRCDRHVGLKARRRRQATGLSQARLGQAPGVGFQQIQKCERGPSPLTAAKLWALAETLGAPIDDLFQGADENSARSVSPLWAQDDRLRTFLACADAGDWIRAADVLRTPRLRRKLLQLIEALTADD